MNYLEIIGKYFGDNDAAYGMYIIHVTLVTKKALSIAVRIGLGEESLKFIEEAGMLHDIGCCKVDFPEFKISGDLPYLCHMTEGHKILENEGLPRHARVASTHTGVGIYADEVREQNLPLEEKDYIPETIEERIISYADLFFSKNPDRLFKESAPDEVRKLLEKFGPKHIDIFNKWHEEFEKPMSA
jgi:uncharacterized protein